MREVRQVLTAVAMLLALGLGFASPASAGGDDYPYRTATTNVADPWGFTKRQCVSFVAWRMKQRNVPMNNAVEKWGSALTWDDAARRLGHKLGTKPVAGAIAHWNAGERSAWYANGSTRPNGTVTAGQYGHVAYVQGVYSDGSVSVAQYNMSGNRSYSVMRLKAPRFIYYGVRPPV
ncbi:MAG TPA: CHAP domain-containing protein [Mycobacteriales bacterium]|nr:CHAP domain-containing protein [Mycobacteriales bacterium]